MPTLPAFMAYEKALCDFLRRNVVIPADDGKIEDIRVEYGGGERAERAIRALHDTKVSRNGRDRQNLITIQLADVEYNNERYCPPENFWNVIGNSSRPATSTRAARVSKGAPYRVSYNVNIYVLYEQDIRYVINELLLKFHHHGGLAYLRTEVFTTPHPGLIPVFLRGYSHNVTSETGEEERVVRASLLIEMEVYLPLPLRFINVFRTYIQDTIIAGVPGIGIDQISETSVVTQETMDLNAPGPALPNQP